MAEPSYLLDSNVCIYLLDGSSALLLQRIEDCDIGEVVTSAIVLAEVMLGIDMDDQFARDRADAFFRRVPAAPFDQAAAQAYAKLAFKRRSFDRLIAAHALALGLIVVTANDVDFIDVPGLRVENWTQP